MFNKILAFVFLVSSARWGFTLNGCTVYTKVAKSLVLLLGTCMKGVFSWLLIFYINLQFC